MNSEDHSGQKAGRLRRILSGEAFLNAPAPEDTALARIASHTPPSPLIFNTGSLIFVPFVLGIGAFIVFALNYFQTSILPVYPALQSRIVPIIACTTLCAGIVWFLLLFLVKEAIVKNLFSTLLRPVEELHGISEYLTNFVSDVDRRMSGIFHCVTNTKITHYFVVQQIRDAVLASLQEIEACYDRRTLRTFFSAHDLLSGGISITDGVIAEVGDLYQIPFSRLEPTLAMIIEDLERGLRGLEAELTEARSSYTLPDSGSFRLTDDSY
jgi:hypothetical protein